MKIVLGDSLEYMKKLPESEKPDVVYLDPMYPEKSRKEKRAIKKDIFMLR